MERMVGAGREMRNDLGHLFCIASRCRAMNFARRSNVI